MIKSDLSISETALAIRKEFDNTFALAPITTTEVFENLLAIGLGGATFAIRVSEISGIYVDRCIMTLPSPIDELLGVVGLRGQIVPVYDLAALMGYVRQAAPRWLVIVLSSGLREPVALTFDTFELHLSVSSQQLIESPGTHLGVAVRNGDAVIPIIQLQSLLQDIKRRADILIKPRSVPS